MRSVDDPAQEGFGFLLVLAYVAEFYTGVMRGRVRRDVPGAVIKVSRDWEYPWALLRSDIAPGQRILDCGAGNSPLPFIWARHGATVHAVDRDAVVCSRPAYAASCIGAWVGHLTGLAARAWHVRRMPLAAGSEDAGGRTRAASDAGGGRRARSLSRLLVFELYKRHRVAFGRIWRPDFWGPVSLALVRRFGVRYCRADLTALPYGADRFDTVACISVLEHMPPAARVRAIAEMTRVLKPDGRLVITYDEPAPSIYPDVAAMCAQQSALETLEATRFAASKRLAKVGKIGPDVIGLLMVKRSRASAALRS